MNEETEDLKSKGDQVVEVKITNNQYKRINELALEGGFMNIGELLESFVGDLTGWHSNGSDERRLACEWYDRAFYELKETYLSFRYYVYYMDLCIEDLLEYEDFFERVYSEYLEDDKNKSHDSKEECLAMLKEMC